MIGARLSMVFLLSLISLCVYGQNVKQEKEIEKVINNLFKGMKDKNQHLLQKVFHEDALMHTVSIGSDGTRLGVGSVSDFINKIAVSSAESVLDERIQRYHIKIDGDMASAWTPYEFYINEEFSHCGVNSFQFIRIDDEWKITYVIDTRRKDDCV